MIDKPKMRNEEIRCSLQLNHERVSGVPTYLTVKDVANLLQVSQATVYRIIDSRQLSFIKVGGSIRIEIEELERYLKAHTVHAIS